MTVSPMQARKHHAVDGSPQLKSKAAAKKVASPLLVSRAGTGRDWREGHSWNLLSLSPWDLLFLSSWDFRPRLVLVLSSPALHVLGCLLRCLLKPCPCPSATPPASTKGRDKSEQFVSMRTSFSTHDALDSCRLTAERALFAGGH